MAFYTGQKVVCIDDSPSSQGDECPAKRGQIYTIAKVIPAWYAVELVEIDHTRVGIGYYGFYARRFRPAVTRQTNIEIFKKALTPKRQSVDA